MNQVQELSMQLANNTQVILAKAQMDNSTKIGIAQLQEEGDTERKLIDVNAGSQSDDKPSILSLRIC